MKASIRLSIHLVGNGGEPAHAVAIRGGGGCNLWVDSVCITATTAEQFRELARAAEQAADIQQAADDRKKQPHLYRVPPSLADLAQQIKIGCEVCGEHSDHPIHGVFDD